MWIVKLESKKEWTVTGRAQRKMCRSTAKECVKETEEGDRWEEGVKLRVEEDELLVRFKG